MFLIYRNILSMVASELRLILQDLGLTQADFARLVGVTTRAVTLWIGGERAIPGPADAYVRVLQMLPPNLRQIELNRLKEGSAMRDGIYKITFQGSSGGGAGMLIFENGRVYGTDTEAVRYDGQYVFDEGSGLVSVRVKVAFPPHVTSVFGVSNPYEWAIDVTAEFDPKQNSGAVAVTTSIGRVLNAQYVFLRYLPDVAA